MKFLLVIVSLVFVGLVSARNALNVDTTERSEHGHDISMFITRASKLRFALRTQMPLRLYTVNDVCPDDYNNRFSIRCVPRVPALYVKFFSIRGVQREKRSPYFIRGDTGDGRVRPVFFGQRKAINITCRSVPLDLTLHKRLNPSWVVIRRNCEDADDDGMDGGDMDGDDMDGDDMDDEDMDDEDMDGEDMDDEDMDDEDMDGEDMDGEDMDGEDMDGEDMDGEDMDGEDMDGEDMDGEDMDGEDN